MPESDKWLAGAADDYYHRNKADYGAYDPVSESIERLGFKPVSVLEIGCANGWRLKKLQEKYDCVIAGVDPSKAAIKDAQTATGSENFHIGTADKLPPWKDGQFNCVIFGYCLWLCEPSTWWRCIAEADRVLADGGAMIVHDFTSALPLEWPHWHNPDTSERERECKAWLFDWGKLFLAHPFYNEIGKQVSVRVLGKLAMFETCTVMRKNTQCFISIPKP